MSTSFFQPPRAGRYALRGLTAPRCLLPSSFADTPGAPRVPWADGLTRVDLLVDDGRIAGIEPAGGLPAELGPDLDGSMVLPGLVDCHTHLDKGHIWPREPNAGGDVPGAVLATTTDRTANWKPDDLRPRMEFGLATAHAKGVVAIRTHLDSLAPQASISFPVFAEMRERWAGRVELQASSIVPMDVFLTDEGRELADFVASVDGNLGANTRFAKIANDPQPPELEQALRNLFRLAAERGLNVDLHVDESTDPAARTLIRVAQIAADMRFPNRILCGHCCSLALQTDEFIEATIAACREARVDIVSLPHVNMYLQDRPSLHSPRMASAAGAGAADRAGAGARPHESGTPHTPRWRGVTVLHELRAGGLRVAIAGDNCRDPFYAYGDHDMLDTFTQAVRIAHLDHPVGDWMAAATSIPAAVMGIDRGLLKIGATADLLVLRARDYSEMLSRHQFDRTVLRAGKAIDTTLPDYRMLDGLMDGG